MKTFGTILIVIGLFGCFLTIASGVPSYGTGLEFKLTQYIILYISICATFIGVITLIAGILNETLKNGFENLGNIQVAMEYYNRFPAAITCEKCSKEFRITYRGKREKAIKCPHCFADHDLTKLENHERITQNT